MSLSPDSWVHSITGGLIRYPSVPGPLPGSLGMRVISYGGQALGVATCKLQVRDLDGFQASVQAERGCLGRHERKPSRDNPDLWVA